MRESEFLIPALLYYNQHENSGNPISILLQFLQTRVAVNLCQLVLRFLVLSDV